ncbi:MAG: aldehyde dehydrogenase family protein [Candidatus Tectomicrobia bacterium]|nr:aldehyde dehydrogenase family protein [Candidatus Tectomicrobia bacterium]
MAQTYLNYIGGEWVAAQRGRTFENRNPARRDEVIGLFQRSDHEDVGRAVQAARRAFDAWRHTPAPKRAEVLYRLGHLLIERKEELARDMTREMGKVLAEARGDVQEAIDMTLLMAGEGRRLFGDTTPSELRRKFCLTVRMPVGVVGLITPWNFPMAIPAWKIMPALICGNTIVFKPATDTPLSAVRLVELISEAGLPPGVLNLVTGGGAEVGQPLVAHPGVRLISFTGSTASGQEIALGCARQMKPYALEMGGKNAIIVMDDANLDLAVDGAVWGGFGTSGQRCTAASRLVVHRAVLGELQERFVARANALRLGDPLRADTDMGPVINDSQLENIHRYTEIGLEEGARLLTGGERATQGACALGSFYQPTVFTEVKPSMRIAREEIFGPTVAIIAVHDLEEAIAVVNDTDYGLSAAIYTADVNAAFQAMEEITTGIVYVNASTIGAEVHLPFGGAKATGNGHREAGRAALDTFSEWRTLYIDYSGKLQRAQIDV